MTARWPAAEGPEGPEGPQGPAGPAGADGDSAYEVAVAGGFVGTQAEWLASLEGDPGPQGDPGPAGADGADGADGATGAQGPQGDPGPAGADGADGAPGESLNPRGFWDDATTYQPRDVVRYFDVDYIAVTSTTNVAPGGTEDWMILAQNGATGQGFTWRGEWSSIDYYSQYFLVEWQGSSYIAVQDSENIEPGTDPAYWELVAQKGADGADGAPGADGADGSDGATGPAGPLLSRTTAAVTTSSLADDAEEEKSFTIAGDAGRIIRVVTSHACRVRLYPNDTYRDADAARAVGTDPTGDHGVLLDLVTGADLDFALSPAVDAYNLDGSPAATLYALIQNLSGGTQAVTVTLHYIQTEA